MNKALIRFISLFVFNKNKRHAFREKLKNPPINFEKLDKFYMKRVRCLKNKIKTGKKIRVAFTVVYDSVFPAEIIYRKMLKDDLFAPVLIVVPDILRGRENMMCQMKKTYEHFSKKYEHVEVAYDFEKDEFVDYSKRTDIVFFANPYDAMADKYSRIKFLSEKGVLPVYISYGMMSEYYTRNHIIDLPSLNLAWKIFADTQENFDEYSTYTKHKGRNVVLSGYAKLDNLAEVARIERKRKKIIIAPHHTINDDVLPLSNFFEYADLFLELPKRYSNIDFVFRPHPLLFIKLKQDKFWGKEKTERYLENIQSNQNVEYQDGGDYFDTFVNSDGIIHDCASFLIEYMFTGHPPCFLLRDDNAKESIFTELGVKCLSYYYQAFNADNIIAYLNNVVVSGDDFMKEKRDGFVNGHLKFNYPHISDYIISHLKETLQ